MTRRALIVIDLQNDYFPGGRFALTGIEAAAVQAARVLAAARRAGDLVVHVRHESMRDDAPFFAPGTEGAQINQAVAVARGEPVVLKHAINAFQGTPLKAILDENAIAEVVIVGAMSHMCIDAATRAAVDHGYKATVIHDAVATRDLDFAGETVPAAQVHAAFMAALAFGYAAVVSAGEWVGG